MNRLLSILRDRGEESTHLRSFSPFAGILTTEERRRIIEQCAYQSLKHLVAVAAALAPSRRIIVLGSSSLFSNFPGLGETNGALETSYDADLLIEGVDDELAGVVQESIGNESPFKAREGYYVDVLRSTAIQIFPAGWETRLIPLPGCDAAVCLEPHDLAAIKLQVGRHEGFGSSTS